jgi:acetyltransferase
LLQTAAEEPWTASWRALPEIDQKRIQGALRSTAPNKPAGRLVRGEAASIWWNGDAGTVQLGRGRDVATALAALAATDRHRPLVESSVDGVDAEAVLNVLFGPARALSDPTSKAALEPYGIPTPEEELCASPSRAASEAGRIGYPVRISLASPDLRIWDHPDLAVDMVDNAARVRDTFRQLLAQAKARLPPDLRDAEKRLLGVMVTATSEALAQLWVRAAPLPCERVSIDIGFADPHGAAAGDCTRSVLPADEAAIERALMRLSGSSLLFGGSAARRKAHREALADVLLRLCTFLQAHRREVRSVELRPLALLLDGSVEAREACVTVSDAFERSLESTG